MSRLLFGYPPTHGTGTRALELLFRDNDILSQLAGRLQSRPGAFQMLFRVSDIDHSRTVGSHARKIELVEDVIVLPDTDAVWRTAVETVERGRE